MGVTFATFFVHTALALGLWGVILLVPEVLLVIKVIGALYIVWLAWKITRLRIKTNTVARAPGFLGGCFCL